MDLGLAGRVAVIAAGSKGLGRAVALELAAEGAAVVISARGREAVEATVADIRTAGGRAHGVVGDVGVEADVLHVVSEAEQTFGPVDILVTNSGGPPSRLFEALSDADWDDAIRVLLKSALTFTRAVLPGMRARRWGRVLHITSITVKQPIDGLMLSNSVRAAVTSFGRTLASEVAADGVTVNMLVPGYTQTERVIELSEVRSKREGTTPEAIFAEWEREIPMRRLGEPREFAALAAFLASERASYITGQSIVVDGGWTRSLF